MNLVMWFQTAWRRRPADMRAVIDDYARMGKMPLILQDIALRGGLYTPSLASTAVDLARAEGRRELALEILTQCHADPATLWGRIEQAHAQSASAAARRNRTGRTDE